MYSLHIYEPNSCFPKILKLFKTLNVKIASRNFLPLVFASTFSQNLCSGHNRHSQQTFKIGPNYLEGKNFLIYLDKFSAEIKKNYQDAFNAPGRGFYQKITKEVQNPLNSLFKLNVFIRLSKHGGG